MVDAEHNGNGAEKKRIAQLILTFDLAASVLRIQGDIPNEDTALDMLGRAMRHYEGLVRLQQIQEYQRQQIEAAHTAGILKGIRG
jgi:hypothetical protein